MWGQQTQLHSGTVSIHIPADKALMSSYLALHKESVWVSTGIILFKLIKTQKYKLNLTH